MGAWHPGGSLLPERDNCSFPYKDTGEQWTEAVSAMVAKQEVPELKTLMKEELTKGWVWKQNFWQSFMPLSCTFPA
jgi:hypothetical protein